MRVTFFVIFYHLHVFYGWTLHKIFHTLICISQIKFINDKKSTLRWKKEVKKNKTITKLQKNQQQHKTHLIPSNPSSELFIVKIGARAYALATRRLPSNTMILAQISSSIWSHLSSTSWMCSYIKWQQ